MARTQTQYWLMKSEPEVYSIDDFKKDGRTLWTGIRNYQARNFMMLPDPAGPPGPRMNVGDLFLFYHSNAEPSACVGVGRIEKLSQPDPDQFNKKLETFEPRASKAKPVWYCAEVSFKEKFKRPVTLDEIRQTASLKDMMLLKRGSRLSIQPISTDEFEVIVAMSAQSLARAVET